MTQGSLQQHVVGLLEFWFSGEFLNSRKQGAPCLLGWTAPLLWVVLWQHFFPGLLDCTFSAV